MSSQTTSYLLYGLLGLVLLIWIISRQVGERTWTPRRLAIMPLIFVVAAVVNGKTLGHDLSTGLAVGLFVAGLVLAVLLGLARSATMAVRPGSDNSVVTRGNGWTIGLWLVSIAVRVGLAFGASSLGAPEGMAEAMLFAAVTIGAQNLVVARRGGLLGAVPQRV
ncbi:hypothetical protein Athai_27750 [Actinocatenispora thailandica]|uniref:DUF1453 domain-containing protein n=1 Tax=Actinocatenispora thailandica TaxID=227318 RepID=A0A7R7HWN5_9ACTN|nr:hypothetical protein [Actinocatenispora thailandica]BCJ35272.1 hypothetical protein Athai_27750 [Actinocatenispora thailandica]